MNSFTFVALAFALVVAVTARLEEDFPHNDFFGETNTCLPNTKFVDKCNYCRCSSAGNAAVCSRMACQPLEKPRIDGFQSAEGLSCPPGKMFFDGCNECHCGASGENAICTLAADCNVHARSRRSAENSARLPHIDNFHESNECTPGQSFKHQCNTCRCSPDGKNAACTKMGCPPSDKLRIDNYVQGVKCPAGETFYDKCNSCRCGPNGASAFCTLMECPGF